METKRYVRSTQKEKLERARRQEIPVPVPTTITAEDCWVDEHAIKIFDEALLRPAKARRPSKQTAAVNSLAKLDEQFAYLEKSGAIYDLVNQEYVSSKAFKMRGPAERKWLSRAHDGKRPTASGLIFEPCAEKVPQRRLNLYNDREIWKASNNPAPTESSPQIQLFTKLLLNLAEGNLRDAQYIAKWLANALRFPGNKSVALVLRGASGTGKGLLAGIIRKIFGKYAVGVGHEQIDSRFNGWIGECVVALANEISVAGFADKKAAEAKLKALITENTVMVEHKGADAYEIRNCTKWLFMSNDNVPLTIAPQDRRYSVVSSSWPLAQSDPALILPIVRATQDAAFIQQVVDYLQGLDLTTFDPQVPHANASRDAVIEDGLSGPQLWWHQELPPAGRYPASVLHAIYTSWCETTGEKRMAVADLLRARPEKVKTVMSVLRGLPEFGLLHTHGQAAKVKCVDIPDIGQGGAQTDWAKRNARLLPRSVPAAPAATAVGSVHGGHVDAAGGPASEDLQAETTSEIAKRPCEAMRWSGATESLVEGLKMPQEAPLDAGALAPVQESKRKPQGHFVRRCLDHGLQLGFAALTAFLLAHGLPVLDVITGNLQG